MYVPFTHSVYNVRPRDVLKSTPVRRPFYEMLFTRQCIFRAKAFTSSMLYPFCSAAGLVAVKLGKALVSVESTVDCTFSINPLPLALSLFFSPLCHSLVLFAFPFVFERRIDLRTRRTREREKRESHEGSCDTFVTVLEAGLPEERRFTDELHGQSFGIDEVQ